MRLIILNAALAALLISTPLALARHSHGEHELETRGNHSGRHAGEMHANLSGQHFGEMHANHSGRHARNVRRFDDNPETRSGGDQSNIIPPLCFYRGVWCNPLGY